MADKGLTFVRDEGMPEGIVRCKETGCVVEDTMFDRASHEGAFAARKRRGVEMGKSRKVSAMVSEQGKMLAEQQAVIEKQSKLLERALDKVAEMEARLSAKSAEDGKEG